MNSTRPDPGEELFLQSCRHVRAELTSSKCCFNLSKGQRGPDPQHRQLMMQVKTFLAVQRRC